MRPGIFDMPTAKLAGVAIMLCLSAGRLGAQAGPPTLPQPLTGQLPAPDEEVFLPSPPGISVTPYATGLEVVWSLDFAPDGRLFIAERAGRIRVVSPDGQLDPTPWKTFEGMQVRTEDGLLGLILDPDFENEPWVYAYYTVHNGDTLVNRVSRFREENGRAGREEILIDNIDSHRIHNGGRLEFGPDGMLYITIGEISQQMRSQNLDTLNGKILRITKEGEIPADNPWPGSPVWAYGLRNPHGLAFRPSDGALFVSDNGPSGEWGRAIRVVARDELTIVPKGGNLGWPLAVGAPNDPRFIDPILAWDPPNPPGDLIFYDADLMPELRGDLFYSALSSQTLMRIRFDDEDNPNRPTTVERWFTGPERGASSVFGRLRGLAVGPDGAIYVGTGNHDGRAPLREGDDRVLRIAPAS